MCRAQFESVSLGHNADRGWHPPVSRGGHPMTSVWMFLLPVDAVPGPSYVLPFVAKLNSSGRLHWVSPTNTFSWRREVDSGHLQFWESPLREEAAVGTSSVSKELRKWKARLSLYYGSFCRYFQCFEGTPEVEGSTESLLRILLQVLPVFRRNSVSGSLL